MSVTSICGPMFAGKSKTLIQRAKEYEGVCGSSSLLVIKYSRDHRYHDTAAVEATADVNVVSHDQDKYPARPVLHLSEVTNDDLAHINKIFIDEGQFFTDIVEFVQRVRSLSANRKPENKISMDITGLDLNHKRENFGHMGEVMALSDVVIPLRAKCADCGGVAEYTRMNSNSNELRNAEIVIGGAELYSPVCGVCYDV